MKRIIHISNLKGGVGKTVFAKALVEYLRAKPGLSVAAYDADGGVGGLLAALGTKDDDGFPSECQDPLVGVGFFDIRSQSERGMMLNCLDTGADIIVIDTAGGSLSDLRRVTDDGEGTEELTRCYEQESYRLTIAHVMSNLLPATKSVGFYLDAFGERADHIAVLNCAFGRQKSKIDFPYWYGNTDANGVKFGGSIRNEFIELGGIEIELPSIPTSTFARVEGMDISYSRAQECRSLQVVERMHVQRFRAEFARQCSSASKLLMPT
jgi:hypothetical protein